MAKPTILFENIYEKGTLTATSEASGFPKENILDWRISTAFRWKASGTTSPQLLTVDLGASLSLRPNWVVIGGHNLFDAVPSSGGWVVEWSDDASAWTAVHTQQTPTDNFATGITWSTGPGGTHRYWRLNLNRTGGFLVAPQIGVLTLGRRLEFQEAAQPDINAYGEELVAEETLNEQGHFLGVNVLMVGKRFRINHGEPGPGMTKTGFFNTGTFPDWDNDFMPHFRTGKPFWFQWNRDEDSRIYLCRTAEIGSNFVGTVVRRGLSAEFVALREVS